MNTKELYSLGIPKGDIMNLAVQAITKAASRKDHPKGFQKLIKKLVKEPEQFLNDALFSDLAQAMIAHTHSASRLNGSKPPAPYKIWGKDFESEALAQIENSCKLPIAVSGALMPDAHVGYGLPIGGVLATKNAVIPYAVGVDIACRMKMTVLDLPVIMLDKKRDRLKQALSRETLFGVGSGFKKRKTHRVMDEKWGFSPVTNRLKDKAWKQLGTSGSGNHFVEFGLLTVENECVGLQKGQYLALLSHSGSRGTGNEIARHYSALAQKLNTELPDKLRHLAWFDLDSHEGQEYWQAMQLMGRYASANHELIHAAIARNLSVDVLLDIENHHNFAWKEKHNDENVIVHRKGATPAGKNVLGIIPGSMATPGYVVRGKGNELSLNSASHGAGRKMSRKAAKNKFNWQEAKRFLDKRDVTLMSAGLDEVPMAYKDIESVMAAQTDLVETLARFDPKIVRMAPSGERPED